MEKNRKKYAQNQNTNLSQNSPKQLIVNQINIAPIHRSVLDVQEWRDAMRLAESEVGWRTKLYDLFNDILLDTHLSSELEKRLMEVTNADLVFVNDKGEELPEINDLIDTPEFEEVLNEIINSKMWGITLLEFETGIKTFKPHSIERRNILPHKGIVVRDTYSDDNGIAYREGTYVNWTIEVGKPKDLGLLLKVAFWVIIKRGGIGDFAHFAELFGMPTRIAEYDVFDEATRIELEKAMKEAGSANYILKPKGTNVELLENNTNSDGGLYDKLINICDKAISISLLGQTLTTIAKSGSGFAQAYIHQDTLAMIVKSDKKFVRRILNTDLKRILKNLGFAIDGGHFVFRDAVPIAERKDEVALVKSLKDIGVPVDDDHVYKVSGIPKPEKYDELKEEMKQNNAFLLPNFDKKEKEDDDDKEKGENPKSGKKTAGKKEKEDDDKLTWRERLELLVLRFKDFFQ